MLICTVIYVFALADLNSPVGVIPSIDAQHLIFLYKMVILSSIFLDKLIGSTSQYVLHDGG